MAKSDYVEQRLLNWALWKMRPGGRLGHAAVNWSSLDTPTGSGYREAAIPVSDCEAADTDAAIKQLPKHLQETVHEHYCGKHTDIPNQARLLGCSVSTVHARIDHAHRLLAAHFRDKRDQAQRERERVEALAGHPAQRLRLGVLES